MHSRYTSLHRSPNGSLPRVVIVGGGFGGLYAARGLARAPVNVTVVDQHNYHLFRPMLYQVATGLLSADEIAAPIRSVLRKQKNAEVLMAEVIGVDTEHHLVRTRESDLPYDYLILATGAHYNYFGHDEWMTFAPGLHSADDADLIRGKILRVFEDAERLATNGQADLDTLRELLTFILVGAGTAGVEMAGTIAEMARMALAHDFRHIDPRSARILLFEAAPRILPGYPEKLSVRAQQHLEQLGVRVCTDTKVEDVDASGVVVAGQRIGSRTVLWTAGVVASPAGQWLGVETDRAGRVKVQSDLSVPGHSNIFAIGDTASVLAPTRNLFGVRRKEPALLQGVAPPAIQEGKYVASVIRRRVLQLPPPAPFCYWDKGSLAIVGRTFAVADVPPFRFWGVPAWLLWLGVHIYFLIGFANRLLVMIQWGLSFLTKRRGVRILSQRQRPLERE
jgi:NADH:quinone reductase (non-electrogenic)